MLSAAWQKLKGNYNSYAVYTMFLEVWSADWLPAQSGLVVGCASNSTLASPPTPLCAKKQTLDAAGFLPFAAVVLQLGILPPSPRHPQHLMKILVHEIRLLAQTLAWTAFVLARFFTVP